VSMQPTESGLVVRGPSGERLDATGFLLHDGKLTTPDPELALALEGLGSDLTHLPSRRAVFSLTDPHATRVVATLREGAKVHGAVLSLEAWGALARAIAGANGDDEGAEFVVRPVSRAGGESLMQRLVSEVAQARAAVTGPDGPQ